MLHVADALLPDALLNGLRDLCDAHADLLEEHDGDAMFSWKPETGDARSLHSHQHQLLMERYLKDHLLPLARPLAPGLTGVEWWCNTNLTSIGTSIRMRLKVVAVGLISFHCFPLFFIPM